MREARSSHSDRKEKDFCDKECFDDYKKENWSGTDSPGYRSSRPKMKGEGNPAWKEDIEVKCADCGNLFEVSQGRKNRFNNLFCNIECYKNYMKNIESEKHPSWKGGYSPYSTKKWQRLREKVLNRDNHSCKVCGKNSSELGYEPHVHHIKPARKFDNVLEAHKMENCVSLCRKHHLLIEGYQELSVDDVSNLNSEIVENHEIKSHRET